VGAKISSCGALSVMEHIPQERQIALFSATMPSVIKKVAEKFLNQPKIVKVKTKSYLFYNY
jgi:ATP-dependent RNA helicase DeaD